MLAVNDRSTEKQAKILKCRYIVDPKPPKCLESINDFKSLLYVFQFATIRTVRANFAEWNDVGQKKI